MKITIIVVSAVLGAVLTACEAGGELEPSQTDDIQAGDVQAGDVEATGPIAATGPITATGAVTTGPVTIDGVQAGDVDAGDVQANDIYSTGQVTATGDILAGDVSAGVVNAGAVSAGSVGAGLVSAGDVTAGDVTATGDVEVTGSVSVTAGAGLGIPSADLDLVQTATCIVMDRCDYSLPSGGSNTMTAALEEQVAQACGGAGGILEQVLPVISPTGGNSTMVGVVRCP